MYLPTCNILALISPPLTGGIFIQVDNMPIDFVLMRASSIPALVKNEQSTVKIGYTGSDILWEAGLGKDTGEELPISWLNRSAKQSFLYIGITKSFAEYIMNQQAREARVEDLEGYMVATKLPCVAYQVFTQREINDVEIFPIPGTDEAMQYVFPNCYGLLGVTSSGKTTERNEIEVLESFYKVTVRMVQATEKLTRRDEEILNDLRSRIASAIQRRKHDVY